MVDRSHNLSSSPEPNRRALYALASVTATFVVCLIRLVGFVQNNAVNLPFDDLWDFLKPLFNEEGPWAAFFYQHGPPRMGLGGLIEWYLYQASHWDVRAVSWAGTVVLILATFAALFLIARLRGYAHWRDAGIPLLLLSPIHWESMTLTPSLAPMILPLLLTFLLAHAWEANNAPSRVFSVVMLSSLLLFTGYGISAAPVSLGLALLLWLRPDGDGEPGERRRASLILILLLFVMMGFAWGYRWTPGAPNWCFPVPNWWDYPRFCALMYASLLGFRFISIGSVVLGALLFALVIWAFTRATVQIWRGELMPHAKSVFLLTGTSLVYGSLTAFGRLPAGIEAAFMWRYMTLMTPCICGLAIAAEKWAGPKSPRIRHLQTIAWIVLTGTIWYNFGPEKHGSAIATAKRSWIANYVATRDLSAANAASHFWVYYPDPNSPKIAERLEWLKQHHLSFFYGEKNDIDAHRP